MSAPKRNCVECGGNSFVEDRSAGDLICRDCGVVAEAHMIDERSEWRTFSEKDKESSDPNRTGGPSNPLLGDAGMSTIIGKTQGTAALSNSLNRLHARTSGTQRSLQDAYRTIGKLCTDLDLSQKVKDRSMHLYKQLTENPEYHRSHGLLAMCCACIYMGSKIDGVPKTFKDITAVAPGAKKTDIGRCYTHIHKFLQEEQQKVTEDRKATMLLVHNKVVTSTSVVQLMPQIVNGLNMPRSDVQACKHMAEKASAGASSTVRPWEGKSPLSILAAIIQIINILTEKPRLFTFQDLYVATGAAEATIKILYKDIYPYVRSLLPPGFATEEQLQKLPVPT